MKAKHAHHWNSSKAFTLIELLVSMAVLASLMVIVFNLSSGTANLARRADTKLENTATLRTALDRMAFDLSTALTREDLPPAFLSKNGSDSLEFYSYVTGYNGTRQLARIGYQIGAIGLERGSQGLTWNSDDSPFSEVVARVIAPENYDLLAPRIFRMAVSCYASNGTLQIPSLSQNVTTTNWSDMTTLTICLATVSEKSLKEINCKEESEIQKQLSDLAVLFPQPSAGEIADGKTAFKKWSEIAENSSALAAAGVPLPVARGIEIRQRVFPLR